MEKNKAENKKKVILELRKLKKYFKIKRNVNLKAVEDVSFKIYEGEKFGVVGESGCGKSTLGRVILQLYSQTSGSAVYHGKRIEDLHPKYIRKEMLKLKSYQINASELYQKSLKTEEEVLKYENLKDSLDEGSPKDSKKIDSIAKKIAKLELKAKEYKKDASRNLREGSRTIGSLILEKDLDKITEIYLKSNEHIGEVHNALKLLKKAESSYQNLKMRLSQNEIKDKEQANALLKDYEQKMKLYEANAEENRKKAKELRKLAFSYKGKNPLPITERTLDPVYQAKLDGNYEKGLNLLKLTKSEMRSIRKEMQMIFQDPAASLDPRQSIGSAIDEAFLINSEYSKDVRKEKVLALLEKVGLKREFYDYYPHSLSGGQKQRVGIARALANNANFIVLDESVSALDVSVKAQILQLLTDLSNEFHLTYFFITHDLGVAKHFCDRLLVMYLGNACELAPAKKLFAHPYHPYTVSLLDSVPRPNIGSKKISKVLEGEVPSAINPPRGCPFHTRCPKAMEQCKKEKPKYIEVDENHFVACHLYNDGGQK